ncbi:DUF4333 domain-containing protein [Nocardioides limicola]|uniref:DUF4333 domain-containing protein n=1 Tax=Nocardioides limicola TaxID=2803368 RepID=UPI00193B2E1B|nr:DUF4333 domain-containing protein [Nocardioides sp. DJM-14]
MARISGVLAGLGAAALVAGCSFTSSGFSLSQDQVEEQVTQQLTEIVGVAPDKIECPGDLRGSIDTEMRCVLTHEGTSYGVTVKVTGVEGTTINYDIQVDDQPMS